jgi:transcriptional regulator with XRE-family HTH domain
MGVTSATISDWERGKAYPSLSRLPRLARVLDVSLDYLLGVSDVAERAEPGRVYGPVMPGWVAGLLPELSAVPEHKRGLLTLFVRALNTP